MKDTVLSLAFSPCPNDTFIFDAMVHEKIDTEGLKFEVYLADVEELNRKAIEGNYDITKLSYHAYAYAINKYVLMNSGSALGENCGPLLISKNTYHQAEVSGLKIAIPGKYTTANFLFSLAFPEAKNKIELLFSDIEAAIKTGEVDAGLIIHENRFTYQERGFNKIIDLGEYWQAQTNSPIPLGGIVIKRSFSDEVKKKVNRVLKRSIEYAFSNPNSSSSYVKSHAQEMDAEVIKKHIGLYVNDYSIDLGLKGKKAIETLFELAKQKEIIPPYEEGLFL